MATIYIDNKPFEVEEGQSLLSACLSLGFNIPYFCWHPAMHSVGSCRQCAVKQFRDENDTRGYIIMSCMCGVQDGMRISIDDPEARQFRAGVIQWLMTNHPHDCPICDEGGECHLQDMTVMTGHTLREFRFKKRTYNNQDLGPFLNHEMNRCIQCYRCFRFYVDYAGGRDFHVFGINRRIYFGRHKDGPLENEFSGNLVEVCPTGVFTDKTLKKHYTRKWDLQTAPSVCVHCSLGCNTIPGERYNMLRRILNRYNGQVNRYFLCDRGRFGYEFVSSDKRIRKPIVRSEIGDASHTVSSDEALSRVCKILSESPGIVGIGSPRASLESNFMLRALVGPSRFYAGLSDQDTRIVSSIVNTLTKGPARSPSLHDTELADAVLVLGEDLTNSAPMLALAMRQTVRVKPMDLVDARKVPRWDDSAVRKVMQDSKGPLFIASPAPGKLDEIASGTYHAAPPDLARLGFAIAGELSSNAAHVTDLPRDLQSVAQRIAQFLMEAQRPLVISGTGCGSESVVQAAANVALALIENGRKADLCYVLPECNSLGLGLMDAGSLDDALNEIRSGKADTVIVLENDLYRRMSSELAEELFRAARHVIAIDHTVTKTTERAHLVLPAGTFAESDGTFINNEGRGQRFFQVIACRDGIRESWRWIIDIMSEIGRPEVTEMSKLDDVTASMAEAMPAFADLPKIAPRADFRQRGMKIARQPHRYSGRTAMLANVTVHEPKPAEDPDTPLAFSMEGYQEQPPSALIPRFWSPGWNSVQSVNKFQSEINGPLVGGDPGLRLIEPLSAEHTVFFSHIPEALQHRPDEWYFVTLYHIFGSEELSVMSPGIGERAPAPYVGLRTDDAAALGFHEGDLVKVIIDTETQQLEVKIVPGLPMGVAGLPVGLPGISWVQLPAWGRLSTI
ncbi:MAG: NADH-quinone oxidoreductase subunit NuoG [Desulfomonile tiedjei]|uniref:NADH-quinone oxidoreductase subunit G n=1 Tax=Desulfomonile tiedjei TaxID=2358 RepID=A0A9D6UZB1_9BACT|nr:NADH-quinone oxidoreductase subunit NuoG [Desulfomonile tiedjei]